jgi:hypothetical protein
LAERTNAADAIGVASYGMIFAFVESVVVFLVVVLLGFLTPMQWEPDRRTAFLGLLFLITSAWGMIGQLLFLWNIFLPVQAIQFLRGSSHPLRIIYLVCLMVVTPTVLLPVCGFLRSNKAVMIMENLTERLSLLTMFYLFFDLLALMIVIVRNIS